MLLRFRFSNFRSFREEQELSLVAVPALKETNHTVVFHPHKAKEGVLPVAAIYGANASGKSNVIRALSFTLSVVANSYRGWKPDQPIRIEPFLEGRNDRATASRFEIDFLIDGIRHSYGFRLDAAAILEEWLHVYPKSKKQSWFHRQVGKRISFSAKMPGANRVIEGLTRKNSLFLSAAAQNNHEALMPVFEWLTGLRFVSDEITERIAYFETTRLCAKPRSAKAVARLLRAADIGIVDLKVENEPYGEDVKKAMAAFYTAMEKDLPGDLPESIPSIRLLHRLGKETLPFVEDNESAGTIAYLRVLGPVLKALDEGGVLCIDELDASLHPLLASQILRLFNDPSTNRKGAQLIFNTHDTTLLGRANLRRDQIWFTEKSHDGSSHLYPLTDFKPRQNENLESGYLQGRYGAIPFLNPRAFLTQIERSNGKT
jgi:AAA15 family ATPase/GTPase